MRARARVHVRPCMWRASLLPMCGFTLIRLGLHQTALVQTLL